MNSLVYFYSRFTEEFLLFSATLTFALISIYCYQWIFQKRSLGTTRTQIPSTVVKTYLSQLINEAKGVRKELSDMASGEGVDPANGENLQLSPELAARINSLEDQLKEKESLVVNINIEKSKLSQEIETLRVASAAAAATNAGNQDQLILKIKDLEARLDEYALFEEDLANLKRLQQENVLLRKKISEMGTNPDEVAKPVIAERKTLSIVSPPAPAPVPEPAPIVASEPAKHPLDPKDIDTLLSGRPVTPPTSPAQDQFEKLVDSVETSLGTPTDAPVPQETAPKSDEDLLKEFENLLDS